MYVETLRVRQQISISGTRAIFPLLHLDRGLNSLDRINPVAARVCQRCLGMDTNNSHAKRRLRHTREQGPRLVHALLGAIQTARG